MEGFSSLYIEPNMIVMKKKVINLQYTGVFFLLLVALMLMVGGAASPWYHLPLRSGDSLQEYLVFLDGPSSCPYSEGDSCIGSNLRHMFNLILAAVIASHVLVGLQLAFVTIHALPSFTTFKWRERLWWPMIVTSAFATMTTTASWVILYLHPSALAADYGNGACEPERAYYCYFNGPTFGPSIGWALFLVASLVVFVVGLALPFFGSPRPANTYPTLN